MTACFHHLLHLNKVTAATPPLMKSTVVINVAAASTGTTASMVATLKDMVDEDLLSSVLTITTTLNHQADSPIVG